MQSIHGKTTERGKIDFMPWKCNVFIKYLWWDQLQGTSTARDDNNYIDKRVSY